MWVLSDPGPRGDLNNPLWVRQNDGNDLCLCFVGPLSDGTIYVTNTYHITKIHTKRSNKKTKDEKSLRYVDGTHGYALISCLRKLMMIASTTFKVCLQLQFLAFFFLSWYLSLCPLTGCWLDKEYVHLTQSMTFVVKPTEKARAHQAYFKFIYMNDLSTNHRLKFKASNSGQWVA